MVKEGFAIEVERNWKDILVDRLFKGPNFHILSGNVIQNVFDTYKYFKLGGENKKILIFGISLEDKNEICEILAAMRIILTSKQLFRVTKRYNKGYNNPPRLHRTMKHTK